MLSGVVQSHPVGTFTERRIAWWRCVSSSDVALGSNRVANDWAEDSRPRVRYAVGRNGGIVLIGVTILLAACGATASVPSDSTQATASTTSTAATNTPLEDSTTTIDLTGSAAGEALFSAPLAVRFNDSCSTCHSPEGAEQGWGPVLDQLGSEAGSRIDGMTAEEYLYQSIVDPDAHQLEGWELNMPRNYEEILSAQEIDDLIAYLLEL